jgi:hypothetical protein
VVVVLFVVEDFIGDVKVGEVVKIDSSDGDLFTNWILRMFYALFAYVGYGGWVQFNALDDVGVSRIFGFKRSGGGLVCYLFDTFWCPSGVRVRYGSGSTSPSRSDYRLSNEIFVDSNPRLVMDESRGFVMIISTVSFSSNTTICEVGLSLYTVVECIYDPDFGWTGTCGEFLLDRTVFSPCRVIPANTPYTVRYRVQL